MGMEINDQFTRRPVLDEHEQDDWVRSAIAEQEEYLKRMRSCRAQPGRAHGWRTFGSLGRDKAWEACVVCGVSRSRDDYERARAAAARRSG